MRLLAGFSAVCLTVGVAGCRGASTPAPITITVLGEDSSNLAAMRGLGPAFEKEIAKSGRNVHVQFEAASFEDAGERANNDFRNGTGKYDVVLQYNFSLAEYASRNYVYKIPELASRMPLGLPEKIESSLFPNVWKEVGFYYSNESNRAAGEEAVGYPFAANTMVLVYNRRFFDDASRQTAYRTQFGRLLRPPTTWDELRDIAQFMTNPSAQECGLSLQGKDGGWLYYEWMNVLHGFGGQIMKKSHGWEGGPGDQLYLDSKEAIGAARFYSALKPYACGDFFNTDAPIQQEQLLSGRVAMALVWSDYLFGLVNAAESRKQLFGFAPAPEGKSLIGGGSYYVNRRSKNPDAAAEFVAFLLRPDNQVELAKRGLCSPVRATYANADVRKLPYTDALGLSLERATYMLEAGPDAELIASRVTEALQRIWRGERAEPVLREVQTRLSKERAAVFAQRGR